MPISTIPPPFGDDEHDTDIDWYWPETLPSLPEIVEVLELEPEVAP